MSTEWKYSEQIAGDKGNYDWPVRFDVHNGYIGITQWNDGSGDRVLLSPGQLAELRKFLRRSAER